MSSPFPGMDPYIEACNLWGDFRFHLISHIKSALAEAALERYLVRIGVREYFALVDSDEEARAEFPPNLNPSVRSGQPDDETAPSTLRAFVQLEHKEPFAQIFEATPEQRLVTCVEVLSPSNKRRGTKGWKLYHRKRQNLLLGGVNLIEIDLLRGGNRMPMLDPWPDSPYTLLVARAKKYQLCKVWPVHYRRPLPPIPVPLAKPDPDLPLDLQPMIESIYKRSRYAGSIDYSKPLSPPLGAEEAAWLEQRLKARAAGR